MWSAQQADLLAAKRYEEAVFASEMAIAAARTVRDPHHRRRLLRNLFYSQSCALALAKRPEQALVALRGAFDAGFFDAAHVLQDRDLLSLRTDRRFVVTVRAMKLRAKANAQLARSISAARRLLSVADVGAHVPVRAKKKTGR